MLETNLSIRRIPAGASAKGWELDQVVVGNSFYRVPSLAPGAQPAGDYENFESELL